MVYHLDQISPERHGFHTFFTHFKRVSMCLGVYFIIKTVFLLSPPPKSHMLPTLNVPSPIDSLSFRVTRILIMYLN